MKKKIKDLTLEELKKICCSKEHCFDCPLYDTNFICRSSPNEFIDNELNLEIEVEKKEKTILVELNKNELRHLINDTISYIYRIKKKVFGDMNFGTDITEVKELSDKQKKELNLLGYYSRKELLDKLEEINNKEFPELTCNG